MRPGSDQHNNDAPPTSSSCAGRRASDIDWLEDVVRDGAEQGQFSVGDQRPRDVMRNISRKMRVNFFRNVGNRTKGRNSATKS
jgi:hypothetical protein